MQAVAGVMGVKPWHLCCFKGESLAAVLPVYERSRLGLRHLICPTLAYYQPLTIFVEPGTQAPRQNWDQLQISSGMAALIAKTFSRSQFNLDPGTTDIRAFSWAGFRASPLYTYVHEAEATSSPTRNEQRKLKTAAQQGYTYDEAFAPDEFLTLFKLMNSKKKRRLGFTYPELLIFLKDLEARALLHQCNLRRDTQIVSSNLVLGTGNGTAYAIMGASLDSELRLGASSLQAMQMLQALHARYQRVDFCGGNIAEIARFKAGLGFELKLFFRIEGKSGLA